MARHKFSDVLRNLADGQFRDDVGRALFTAAQRVEVESKISLTTGAVSGAGHVASKPGEPPNNDTGFLAASHETTLVSWDKAQVRVEADYATALEFGDSSVAARPFLAPAARKIRPQMNALVKRAVKQAIARAIRRAG